ncbi:hypothetical protein SAMN05444003_2030 [Cognatiyoonia sediminum]|uniref:Uncharacterized protein n=1 Tax=Cognatiyoonia sediminum TaxID=1508389 RepID=A0A1M5Q4P8_9RHOB|nr:hypothetical protein SAMN05444003_2030 [Cognatiyoonia sediminum]
MADGIIILEHCKVKYAPEMQSASDRDRPLAKNDPSVRHAGFRRLQ